MRLRGTRGPDYRGPRLTPLGAVLLILTAAFLVVGTVDGSGGLIFVGALSLAVVAGASVFQGPRRKSYPGDEPGSVGVSPLGDVLESGDDE